MKLWILVLLPSMAAGHLVGGTVRSSRHNVGAPSDLKFLPQAPETSGTIDPRFMALQFATCVVNSEQNSTLLYTLGDTSGVTYTEQVTAGMTYKFYNVPFESSTCPNPGNLDCAQAEGIEASKCATSAPGSEALQCDFVIQFQAWMNPAFSRTSSSCSKI